MKKITELVERFIKGLIVGVAAITAGAGTIAMVLGIYDRCMEIIANPFKKFKENLIYVLPIVLGIGISALLGLKVVVHLLKEYEAFVKYAFLGIILGGIPALIKRANLKGKNKKHIIAFILAAIFTIILTKLGNMIPENVNNSNLSAIELFLYGLLYSFGAVMPGMTTVHILMFLGVYGPICAGIGSFNLSIIIPFGLGYLIMVLLTANLITYLFKNFYGYTYYSIIGFSVLSLQMLVPPLVTTQEKIFCPIIAIIATLIMYGITKIDDILEQRKNNKLEKIEENN